MLGGRSSDNCLTGQRSKCQPPWHGPSGTPVRLLHLDSQLSVHMSHNATYLHCSNAARRKLVTKVVRIYCAQSEYTASLILNGALLAVCLNGHMHDQIAPRVSKD